MQETSFSSFLKVVVLALVPLAAVMLLRECHNYKKFCERTSRNQDLLLHNGEVEIGQTQSGKPTASVSAILLEPSSLKRNPDSLLAVTKKELKIKNSRMVAAARTTSSSSVDIHAAVTSGSTDTTAQRSDMLLYMPPQRISWSDPWVSLRGTMEADSFHAHIEIRDTLQMIIHRVPKKFLFFRYGTKAVRMEVVSQNPHTRLSYPKLLIFAK